MHIVINGHGYTVSMKWEQDDTIHHFVTIDDNMYKLDIESKVIRGDDTTYITAKEFREILAEKIKAVIDTLPSNRRPQI